MYQDDPEQLSLPAVKQGICLGAALLAGSKFSADADINALNLMRPSSTLVDVLR
jgi:hypothetical protein